jgi:putative transposase
MARERAIALIKQYENRFPKAIEVLEDGLEDSLSFYAFPGTGRPKNCFYEYVGTAEQGDSPQDQCRWYLPKSRLYLRLVTTYLMEYAEDWSFPGRI